MKKNVFEDIQTFSDKRFTKVVGIFFSIILFITFLILNSSGKTLIGINLLLLSFGLVGGILLSLRLYIGMDIHGIHYQFRPFHFEVYTIPWASIQSCQLTKVSAIRDFGGIGLRYTLKKKGLIIGSGPALEIRQKNGKVLVLSISKEAEASSFLNEFRP